MRGLGQAEFIGIAGLPILKAVEVVYLPGLGNNGTRGKVCLLPVYVEYEGHGFLLGKYFGSLPVVS